jgi:hypothetical protein
MRSSCSRYNRNPSFCCRFLFFRGQRASESSRRGTHRRERCPYWAWIDEHSPVASLKIHFRNVRSQGLSERSRVPLLTDLFEFINLMALFVESLLGPCPLVNSGWRDGLFQSPSEIKTRRIPYLKTVLTCNNVALYGRLFIVSRVVYIRACIVLAA